MIGLFGNALLWKFAPASFRLWWNVAGFVVAFSVGYGVSRLTGGTTKDLSGLVWYRGVDKEFDYEELAATLSNHVWVLGIHGRFLHWVDLLALISRNHLGPREDVGENHEPHHPKLAAHTLSGGGSRLVEHTRIVERLQGATETPGAGRCMESIRCGDDRVRGFHFRGGGDPLSSMRPFLREVLGGLVYMCAPPAVFSHPDDGFSVVDYRKVDEVNETWGDIHNLGQDVELIFDLVINHASASHQHFREFLADQTPGNRYFLTAPEDEDVHQVTRPRAAPLLQRYETASGPRWVWCTFSRDQVDWDFSNPDVLYEFVDIFLTYLEHGASWVRLDAIAYLWKEQGTPCVHLPQTHAVVKLLRILGEEITPDCKILTETNVPLPENLSYFGDGDEAHIVYNFSLPPLLVHGLLTGNGEHLTEWCNGLPALPEGCTYLNFTASHDGIGLRPAEGILDKEEVSRLVECVRGFGGQATERRQPDGSLSPYEANIALFDAFKGTLEGLDSWQGERFLASQAVMLCMAGVPAFYYNSFLSAPNNGGFSGNGPKPDPESEEMDDGRGGGASGGQERDTSRVLGHLQELIGIRKKQPAFHPECPQEALVMDGRAFVVRRHSSSQTLICATNLSKEPVSLERKSFGESPSDPGQILYPPEGMTGPGDTLTLPPYGILWIAFER